MIPSSLGSLSPLQMTTCAWCHSFDLFIDAVMSRRKISVGATWKLSLRTLSFGIRTVVAFPLSFQDNNGTKAMHIHRSTSLPPRAGLGHSQTPIWHFFLTITNTMLVGVSDAARFSSPAPVDVLFQVLSRYRGLSGGGLCRSTRVFCFW